MAQIEIYCDNNTQTLRLRNHLRYQKGIRELGRSNLMTPTLDGASGMALAYGSLRSPEGFDRVS